MDNQACIFASTYVTHIWNKLKANIFVTCYFVLRTKEKVRIFLHHLRFSPSSVLCSAFLKRFHLSHRLKSRWRHLKQRSAIDCKLSPSESNCTFSHVFIGSKGILLLLSFFLKEIIAIYLLRLRSRYKKCL